MPHREFRYQHLFNQIRDGIYATDKGIFIEVNKAMTDIFGYSYEELIGMNAWDLAKESIRETVRDEFFRRATEGDRSPIEIECQKKDGTCLYAEIRISYSVDDKIMYGTVHDISMRKMAEKAISESEERYRLVVETAKDVIYTVDTEGTILSVNQACEKVIGWKREELIGKNRIDFMHPEELEYARKNQLIHNEGLSPERVEFRFLHKAGHYLDVDFSTSPIIENGKVIGRIGIGRDISERKKDSAKIKASLEEKEVLLREIHHRVKNNLQVISALLSLQSATVKDNDTLEIFMELKSRIKSISIVHERLYKSESLTSIDYAEYVDSLITELVRIYKIDTEKIKIKIEVDSLNLSLDTAIPLGLIINELVTNCFKYAFIGLQNGKIFIGLTRKPDDVLELSVKDNGIGLPKDFDQNSSETLGIRMIHLLTDQLQGKLILSSKAGTQVKVLFKESAH